MALPHQRELQAEEGLLNEPLYQDLRPRAVDFIERLHQAERPDQWFDLHRDLLIELGGRQAAIDATLPEARRRVRAEIRELAGRQPKPIDEIRAQQTILERVGRQELVAQAIQHTLRQIGDGIAWRALGYDRRAFTILGEGERVGRLAAGVGFDAEIDELGRLWEEEGVFAIHNDLTNCLRHADLTAIRSREDCIDVTLIEVKAGPRPNDTPQMLRLDQATTLLREGRQATDQGIVRITVVPTAYRTYLGILADLIATAHRDGFAWARPHESLMVGAVDYHVWGRESSEYNARSDAQRRSIGWGGEEPETLAWTASKRRMRDRGWSFSQLAPYTIFPLPAADAADLTMGFVDLAYSVHLPLLERALTRNGVEVRAARSGEASGLFLEASRRAVGLRVPPHLREQMMVELMTPDTLFAALDHVLTLNEVSPLEANDRRVVVFAEERSVWESAEGSPG